MTDQTGGKEATMKKPILNMAEKAGAACLIVGLLLLLGVWLFGVSEGFWVPYTEGCRLAGWLAFLTGALLLPLAAAKRRTAFFALHRPITADRFALIGGAVAAAVVLLIVLLTPRLPRTPQEDLPSDPKAQAAIRRMESNFRVYVAVSLAVAGGVVISIPACRFFRG